MGRRAQRFKIFCRYLHRYLQIVCEILLGWIVLICAGGLVFSYVEDRRLGESIYFAFITGLTIGYGDITPQTTLGRLLSVILGVMGMILMGLIIAVANRALADSVKEQLDGPNP